MPIKHRDIDREFSDFVDDGISDIKRQVVDVFVRIGDYGYKLAVERGNYQDRTGNLRSSIGYGVVLNGRLVKIGGFEQFLSGSDGVSRGKDLLNELVSEVENDRISLILVAGAEYAMYVESIGYDVMTFSEIECFHKAEEMINELFK